MLITDAWVPDDQPFSSIGTDIAGRVPLQVIRARCQRMVGQGEADPAVSSQQGDDPVIL
jgi:hypothetical protein